MRKLRQVGFREQYKDREMRNDIRMEGMVKDKTQVVDETKNLCRYYFRLSETPPEVWKQLFEGDRAFRLRETWPDAWIDNAFLVTICTPRELKEFHIADLEENVESTNGKYRGYLRIGEGEKLESLEEG